MSKYLVEVVSKLLLDENDMKDYIAEREHEWGIDHADEIERLKNTGKCNLSDEYGNTRIVVTKVDNT